MRKRMVFKSIAALLCALACVNFLCYFYYAVPGTIIRKNAATDWIYEPGGRHLSLVEGYAITHFDENGYSNPSGDLSDSFVLMLGSSQAEGTHVSSEKRIASVLNILLGGRYEDDLKVYNMSRAGNFLPDILQRFSAAIEETPGSSAVVIEIHTTTFSTDEILQGLNQVEYNPAESGSNLVNNLSFKQKLRLVVMDDAPYLMFLKKKQLANVEFHSEAPFGIGSSADSSSVTEEGDEDYGEALESVFHLIRSLYDKPIIICYHPEVELEATGEMIILRDDTYDEFVKVCEDNDIYFLDTGDAYLKAYQEDYTVPYGFSNTSMAYGHLNEEGHRTIAEEIYRILTEELEVFE